MTGKISGRERDLKVGCDPLKIVKETAYHYLGNGYLLTLASGGALPPQVLSEIAAAVAKDTGEMEA